MSETQYEDPESLMKQIKNELTIMKDESTQAKQVCESIENALEESLQAYKQLKKHSRHLREDKIQLQCDKEQLELEIDTIRAQLNLHIEHSGNDQSMLMKMMSQIEELKEEKYDLHERLAQEMENNRRRLSLLSSSMDRHQYNQYDEQTNMFLHRIEKYHCKVLSLEAVIENLRRKGIDIDAFPTITRFQRDIQVDNIFAVQSNATETTTSIDEMTQTKMNELLHEIKFLKTKNDATTNKFRAINQMTQELKCELVAQQKKYQKLKHRNLKLKQSNKEKDILLSNRGRGRVIQLVSLLAFIVGMVYTQPKKPTVVRRFL